MSRRLATASPENWLEAARRSPVYKMAMDWKIAFPLHPEYRTLPMVWYVPPLSPIQSAAARALSAWRAAARCEFAAHPRAVSRQPAHRRAHRADRAWR